MSKRKRTVSLAMRPAAKKARVRQSAIGGGADGLYAQVFASDSNIDDVTAEWVTSFQENEANGVAQFVNFALRCAGCNIKIDEDDAADVDHCPQRLGEIQDEFQAQDISDYPLIAKNRGATAFKQTLTGFCHSLIQTLAQSGILYSNALLMENLLAWMAAMSTAGNRPFRHTSTVIGLAITTALCAVASEIVENTSKKDRQRESEAQKKRVNKGRVSALDQEIEELNQQKEVVDEAIKSRFDAVYIHRYRDVDPKIRLDSLDALADWIVTYPDKFFDGQYLRYMGWVLAEPNSATRLEVLKQLHRLFCDKEKHTGLNTFAERFRSRIVEMATHDTDVNVRAAAVQLLDTLREAGFLEPDDVDTVGKLVFDVEPKVRKAVVGFFAENINGAYELLIEDMGGQEALDEQLGDKDDDEQYTNPRLEWLKLKCLVEQLAAYDSSEDESSTQVEKIGSSGTNYSLIAAGVESSFSLATQALYDAIPEIRSWEVLAGYLLHDHSQTVQQNGGGEDAETMLKQNCKLSDKEETILLDVLTASVKMRLQRLAETQKDKKKTKAEKQALQEEQAETVKQLSNIIPQLLKKFGALPEAASLCLRLERQLDLDIFQELRQNNALTALLDDVNRQFLSHHNEQVLDEAIESILHALTHEDSRESTEAKVQSLWDELINTFDAIRGGQDLSSRGSLPTNALNALSHTVLKISKLAKISEPSVLDRAPTATGKSKSKKDAANKTPPIASLLEILDRGVPTVDTDEETDIVEDFLVRYAMSATTFYFAWKVKHLTEYIQEGTQIPDDELETVASRRDTCIKSLVRIMESRKGADDVRMEAAYLLLDMSNLFYSLQNAKAKKAQDSEDQNGEEQEESNEDWQALCQKIDAPTTKLLLQILTAAEAALAKRTKKQVEEPDVDDDPIDPDDEPESSEDEEEGEGSESQVRTLMATGRLCFLGSRMVHGVRVGTLDKSVRKRLERNKTKLGHDWKEVVNHLNDGASKPQRSKTTKAKAKPKPILVEESDMEEMDDEIED